ncbi:MAG: AAA family ATPase [Caldimicrobium sp.]|nr:AAA family ATPase [Caldimicrobium sp.]MCX7614019.1 AAA family ATPase [Caldimicrobium sp.]MDW8182886.1 AAA family ATPase [Caldimicrobium sp.]
MHIKKLEIYGFKSFPYKITLPFSKGVTAIVGPNGSGKSNILDAIKWVLGEQSPKRLRVKEISDLIYSGNNDKKIDFAEVKIVFTHDPPLIEKYKDYEEITVIRRFYRDGEGEFFINNKPCRLKDIHFLFLGLGVNPQSYGVIDQGEVNKFLEVTSKERKRFLEDLAGVSKIRVTEEETLKNLQNAKQNLIRIEDLLREVGNQYIHLQKQAEIAKRYLYLRENLKKLSIKKILIIKKKEEKELEMIIEKLKDLKNQKENLNISHVELEEREKLILKNLIIKEREYKDKKREKEEIELEIENTNKKLGDLYQEERNIMQKLDREKIKYETDEERRKTSSEELDRIKGRLNSIELQKKEIEEEREKIKIEAKKWEDEYIKTSKEFEISKNKYNHVKNKREQIKERIDHLSSEKNLLEKEADRIKRELSDYEKTLAELDSEKSILEKRLEELQSLINKAEEDLKNLKSEEENLKEEIQTLKDKKINLLSDIKNKEDNISLLEKVLKEEKGTIPEAYISKTLGTKLELDLEKLSLLESFYGEFLKAIVVENWEELNCLLRDTEHHLFIFSKDISRLPLELRYLKEPMRELEVENRAYFGYFTEKKLLFTPLGLIVRLVESKKGYFTITKEKRLMETLLGRLKEELKKVTALEKERFQSLNDISGKINKAMEDIKKYKTDSDKLSEHLLKIEKQKIRIAEAERLIKEKLTNYSERIQSYNSQIQSLRDELQRMDIETATLSATLNLLKEKLSITEREMVTLGHRVNDLDKAFVKVKTEEEQLIMRKNELQGFLERIDKALRESKYKLATMTEEQGYIKSKIQELKLKKGEQEKIRKDILEALAELENQIKEESDRREEIHQKKREIEKNKSSIENKIHNLEITLMEKKMILENLQRELKNWLDENEPFYVGDIFEDNPEALDYEIRKIKEELKNYEEVNLASIKEFEIVKERYESLCSQKDDIERAIREIELLLEDLQKKATEQILTTLKEVNLKLREIFPLIFTKGQAELYLTEEDPLTSGLDLRIELPQREIKHLNMLSGGEKALCVIALLISFYLTKPGPFCILDEVDAPLDDKNSLKFIRLLHKIKEHSQIILVTHNHNVIKEVDNLIGVTMEERGVSKVVRLKLESIYNDIK